MPDRTLDVVVGETVYQMKVPEALLTGADEVFDKFDRDMARGWQMSRTWTASPDAVQRCQIVADRLLTALHQGRWQFVGMACAYIVRNINKPDIKRVVIDTDGDMTQTTFE